MVEVFGASKKENVCREWKEKTFIFVKISGPSCMPLNSDFGGLELQKFQNNKNNCTHIHTYLITNDKP